MRKISIRALATDFLNPIVWNLPGNKAKKFYRFSLTEYSSVLDLTLAARLTSSDERAAKYMRHLQDELKHTHIFFNQANKLGSKSFTYPGPDYEDLFNRLGEKRFLAFVYLGEKRGCMQFISYAKYFAKKSDYYTSSIFSSVLEDEIYHMQYTRDLLFELCGNDKAAHKEITRAKLWESYRTWMRTGKMITSKLFFFIMILSYPFLLPYKLFQMLHHVAPKQSGWS